MFPSPLIAPLTARSESDDDVSPSCTRSPSPASPSSPLDVAVAVSSFHRRVPSVSALPMSPRSGCDSSDAVTIFAIGSMMNATAIALRGITIVAQSAPAVLRGYRLVFRGVNGMADIDALDGAHFHGVVHRISARDVVLLDRIEIGYTRRTVVVSSYDGRSIVAWVYEMDRPKPPNSVPPSARYLRILTDGAESFGISADYISSLRAAPCRPRPLRLQRLVLPPKSMRLRLTREELAKYDGADGKPFLLAVNGKILRYDGESTDTTPSNIVDDVKREYGGKEITHLLALHCYDPEFPVPSDVLDMCSQHKRAVEDMIMRRSCCLATFNFSAVGTLIGAYDDADDAHVSDEDCCQ